VTEPARAPAPWSVFAAVALGTFMATLDSSIVNVALPTLATTFHASVTQIEWVSLAYMLTITGLLLPFGRLGDALGRRRIFLIGLGLFTLGSAACALSVSAATLVAARVLQGTGAGMLSANSVALITAAFPREMRGRALGMVGAVVGLGLTVGAPLGGFLLAAFGWPSIFLVNLPIGVLGGLYARAVLAKDPKAPSGARPPFDIIGALLALSSLVLLTLFLSRGAAWGWSSAGTLLCAFGALAALAGFIATERRASDPLIDLAFFADAKFRVPMLSLFLSFVALFAAVFLVPFYLERTGGMRPDQVGRVLVVIPLLLLMVSPISGALSDRLGSRALALAGLATTSAGLALLSVLIGRAGDRPLGTLAIVAGLFVVGLGPGLFQPPNSSAAMSAVPPERLGLAGGLLATMRNLGMLFGIGLAAAVYEGRERIYARAHGATFAAGLGMRDAFLAAAIVALLAVLLVALGGASAKASPRRA
jgi:EmrB/QacA subfamily drug resistance transporter